jgi:hypothetical protein
VNLTVGILAIGSLYWKNDVRERWRQSRLKIDDTVSVTAPFRYGRLFTSPKRRDTYTMVFSSSVKEHGRAKAIPCINDVSSVPQLVHEAELLWAAERSAAKSNNRLSGSAGAEPSMLLGPDL